MSRFSNRILLTLLLGLFLQRPRRCAPRLRCEDLAARAGNGQTGNLYGSNPYEQTEGEEGENQRPQDTTKKERKIRKPLESYFFNDSIRALNNFKWHVSRDFNRVEIGPLDTTLTDYRIDYPFYREDVGDIAQGALGQTSPPLNYFRRPQFFDFSFASPYYAYTYNMENVPFYNTKKPMIRMNYAESGQKRFREENFGIMHAQNISPTTGFNIDYKARGTRGQYVWSRTKNHNLAVAVSHTGRRYSVHAGYYNNHIERRRTAAWSASGPLRTRRSRCLRACRCGWPTPRPRTSTATTPSSSRSPTASRCNGSRRAISRWRTSRRCISAIRSSTVRGARSTPTGTSLIRMNGTTGTRTAISSLRRGIITITGSSTLRRRVTRSTSGTFRTASSCRRSPGTGTESWGTLDAGIGIDMHTYSQFELKDYLTGKYTKVNKTSYFFYGSVSGKIKKYVDWDGNLRFYPSGYRGGDLSIGAHLALKGYLRGHPLILEGRFSMDRRSPTYWQENLFSNHYIWNTPLSKENETRFEVKFSVPDFAFEAGAWQGVVSDKIYYASDSNVAQHSGNVSLTSVYARKDFRLGGLHLDNRVLLQWSTDQDVVPVPLLSAFLSYYYEFWVVRDVLRLQIGLDGRYNTKYYAPGYNPALSVYYNQREVETGITLYGRFRHGKVEENADIPEISACEQGTVR